MGKIIPIVLACMVSLTTTALLSRAAHPNHATDRQEATDGAFRDGLYVGRLAAERGLPLRPPIGRWVSKEDQTSFDAGYRRGYEKAERNQRAKIAALEHASNPRH